MPDIPQLHKSKDLGYGYKAVFEAMNREPILMAHGAQVTTSNQGDTVRITLRSDREDFEGDSMYLLDAEMVVGRTVWVGTYPVLEGVLTKFCWRTEEMLDEEMEALPSGDGCYVPKTPMPESDDANWMGQPAKMMRCRVALHQRRDG